MRPDYFFVWVNPLHLGYVKVATLQPTGWSIDRLTLLVMFGKSIILKLKATNITSFLTL